MNMYKVMIGAGILLSAVLVISNMVAPVQAFVLFTYSKTYMLAFVSIIVGIILGVGIHGFFTDTKQSEDDTYKF